MFGVRGIARIVDDPVEKSYRSGYYFNFVGEAKDPHTKNKRQVYRISIFVGKEFVELARHELVRGAILELRHADLDGARSQTDPNHIFMQVKSNWRDLEILVMAPRAELQA